MNCPHCNNPLLEGTTTYEHCKAAPLPTSPLPSIQGSVNIGQQSGGIAAGANSPQNQYLGPTTINNYGTAQPPLSLHVQAVRRWFHVPSPNRIFTGREQELAAILAILQSGNAVLTPVPAALRGMGGVGKTQTAVQYVHLHGAEYALVVWVRGDTPAEFKAQLAALAPKLDPAIRFQAEQEAVFEAVRQWLNTHGDWLLVVDNASDLPELDALLPQHPSGRVLLTTRERVPPNMATSVEIQYMDEMTGAILLLRRAGTLQPEQALDTIAAQTQADAQVVSRELGGLALALDQAGAYMHECTLSPGTYLDYYRKRRQQLHKDYKSRDHTSIAVTFNLALEQVQNIPEHGTAAMALAFLCAFLSPDAIPDEVFLTFPNVLPDVLAEYAADEIAFSELCEAACRYALLHRDINPPGLSMHRLAQEALRDGLNETERKAFAGRAMEAINAAFPEPDYPTWPLCARLLSHSLVCVQHLREYVLHKPYATRLLQNTAGYLQNIFRYMEAKPLYLYALTINKQIYGSEHNEVIVSLNNMGVLYRDMGNHEEAESVLKEAIAIAQRALSNDDPNYAALLDNLAGVYYYQGRFEEAIVLNEQALEISRRVLGLQHPKVATRLNNLANEYAEMKRFAEAETLMQEALAIARQTIGQDNPDYAACLVNLAGLYVQWSRVAAAKPLLTQALSIYTQVHGSQNPNVAVCHYWLGQVSYQESNLMAASACFGQAWEINAATLGPQHPDTINARQWLDRIQRRLGGEGGLLHP